VQFAGGAPALPRAEVRNHQRVPRGWKAGKREHVGPNELAASSLSTHAQKTELRRLLGEIRPLKSWSKRATLAAMAAWAVDEIDADTADPRERRAFEIAQAVIRHQRS
jgi:hypothetical protein